MTTKEYLNTLGFTVMLKGILR